MSLDSLTSEQQRVFGVGLTATHLAGMGVRLIAVTKCPDCETPVLADREYSNHVVCSYCGLAFYAPVE